MTLKVTNPFDHAVDLHSFCGDSVHVPARARGVPVADKFGWDVPKGIRVVQGDPDTVDPTKIVKGRMHDEHRKLRPPKDAPVSRATVIAPTTADATPAAKTPPPPPPSDETRENV